MTIHGAVIIEQGVTFAIVAVRQSVTQYTVRITQMRQALSVYFPNMPIILMSQDSSGTPHFYGRKDIVARPSGATRYPGRSIMHTSGGALCVNLAFCATAQKTGWCLRYSRTPARSFYCGGLAAFAGSAMRLSANLMCAVSHLARKSSKSSMYWS